MFKNADSSSNEVFMSESLNHSLNFLTYCIFQLSFNLSRNVLSTVCVCIYCRGVSSEEAREAVSPQKKKTDEKIINITNNKIMQILQNVIKSVTLFIK